MKKKKQCKTSIELVMGIRREWTINPRTRVQSNELKDKKKIRQKGKKESRGSYEPRLSNFLDILIQ